MIRKVALSFICILGLSACSASDLKIGNAQLVASPDKVSAMLADAADRAAESIETLAAIEQARAPQVSVSPIHNAPPELRRAMSVNWIGPAEPITKSLAGRAGYMFQVIGNPPPVPVVVSVNVENKSVIEILRNIGLQLGLRADVRVDSNARMIEIHYAPVAGVGE